MRLHSSRKYVFWCLFINPRCENIWIFSNFMLLLVQSLLKFFIESCCSCILLFLVPFINELTLDPIVENTSKPPIAEKLSRTTYWDPQISEKLKTNWSEKSIMLLLFISEKSQFLDTSFGVSEDEYFSAVKHRIAV